MIKDHWVFYKESAQVVFLFDYFTCSLSNQLERDISDGNGIRVVEYLSPARTAWAELDSD